MSKGEVQGTEDETEDFNVFSFSTEKTVEFTLKYDVPKGYEVYFEMYSKSPLTLDAFKSYVKDYTLVPFFSGRADENGRISYKGNLPATVNEIYAYCSGFGMPVLMKASVSASGTVSNFEVTKVPTVDRTRANAGASGTTNWRTYNVTLKTPTLPSVRKQISEEDKNLIEKSFPTNQIYDLANTYYQPSIKLLKEAKLKIYSVSNGLNSERTNALAYFVYKNEKVVPADVNSDLNLVFPELNKTVPAEGEGYQLLYNGQETFEAGSYIGFSLFPDIKPNEIATNNAYLLYSCFNNGGWNSYSYPAIAGRPGSGLERANVPHMVLSLLRTDKDGHAIIAIAFEDQPWSATNGTNKGDFRDDIFILEIDPASSLPGDLPTPPTEDPAYDYEYNFSGILCFEDSWPNKGDYDMNDVIVSYDRTICIGRTTGPVAIKETYTFLNNGASYSNGFGFQLVGLKKNDIQKCTVTSDYKCQGQGLDDVLDPATVMLFDNGKSLEKGATFSVYTSFANGQNYEWNHNPFIVVNGYGSPSGFLSQGRLEVHLPTSSTNAMRKYLPTNKANTDNWGNKDDKSDPSRNIFYVRKGNYPFALEINWDSSKYGPLADFDFKVPQEKLGIEKTYPKFTNWVESNAGQDVDWYLHPNK